MCIRRVLFLAASAFVLAGGSAHAACHPYVAAETIETAIEKGGSFAIGVEQAKNKANLDGTPYYYEETLKIIQTSPTYKGVKAVIEAEQANN